MSENAGILSFKTSHSIPKLSSFATLLKENNMKDSLWTALALIAFCGTLASARYTDHRRPQAPTAANSTVRALKPPANGRINVAFIISKDTTVIDLAGPWEVFGDAMFTSKGEPWTGGDDMVMPFNLYTVSDSLKPITTEGGMIIVPNYTFATAPKPQVIVIPAQGGRSAAQKEWLLTNAKTADVTMSVCTGATMLAAYGLLDHQRATTHHMYIKDIQKRYPSVDFVTGTRFVENDNVSTAGGLTSGIDLALHVVERYYGRAIAQATADFMEYKGELWKDPQYGEVKEVAAKH
jgi:transcriptional regulator GlxA family with amidase domain